MRLFQVITRMARGGAQRVVLELLSRLPRGEFEPALVCGAADGGLLPEARAAGVEVILIPELVREVRPRADAAAGARLAALFRRRRPDVVHAHTYKAGMLAGVAARWAGVPAVIVSPHGHIFAPGARIPGVPAGGWKLRFLRWATSAAQAWAHRVTALSETDRSQQIALGLGAASRYVVVPNGIDVERYAAPRPRLFAGRPVVGAVGRFSPEKGQGVLLEAFARARAALPAARLVLVGYGEAEGELREAAARAGLGETVVFAGERDSAEVLSSFDVFVQPSLYESQGLAILEAMAAGCPVIATDVGGVRDVVRDGETGVLVPAGDPAALAAAIVGLAGAPERADALAARARAWVRERFSVERMVAAYADLYRNLLGWRRASPG
ncbi:MAG TPA: GT4 family glycosyltransferase PelF, partial [Planctomycetota bacterium]|nr:GT4 family glycosyltransferase PelF [Planctomycetota bacterium]